MLAAIPLSMLSMVSASYASVDIGGKSSGNTEPYPYISPTPGEFPIIGWGIYKETSRSVFKDFFGCGFNAAMIMPNKYVLSQMLTALNPVAGEDTIKLSLIQYMEGLMDNYKPEETQEYMDYIMDLYSNYMHSGNQTPVSGWMPHDEPTYYQLDAWAPYFHTIAQHDPTRMVWMNLFGDPKYTEAYRPVESDLNNRLTLKDYIEAYCEKFRPGVLSYDYYPFNVDTSGVDRTIERGRLDDFYTALQLYSEISKKRDRPFWAFCQCKATCVDEANEYKPTDGHPVPTEIFLRYEAFNALAFGAQGIEYWRYQELKIPVEKPDTNVYYALVTKDGKKTPAWYFAQRVNKEIKSWTNVFLGAKLDSYYFVGDPRDTSYCDYKVGPSADAIYVQDLSPRDTAGSNRGALVSTLVNGDNNYVVIVNQSPYEPVSLRLGLNEKQYSISELKNYATAPLSLDNVIGSFTPIKNVNITLSPGQYTIYSYRRKSK